MIDTVGRQALLLFWRVVSLHISPVIDWCPVQGVPCFLPKVRWDKLHPCFFSQQDETEKRAEQVNAELLCTFMSKQTKETPKKCIPTYINLSIFFFLFTCYFLCVFYFIVRACATPARKFDCIPACQTCVLAGLLFSIASSMTDVDLLLIRKDVDGKWEQDSFYQFKLEHVVSFYHCSDPEGLKHMPRGTVNLHLVLIW